MAVATPSQQRWLFGPAPDLLLGCGLLYVGLLVVLASAGDQIVAHTPAVLLPLLIMLFGMPHYGGTLLRVYGERESRRSYVIFSVYAKLVIFALFVWGVHRPYVASILLTVYLTWSPWHYSGQNYGISMMFLRRRGVPVDASVKRWLYASFILSFVLTLLVMHISLVPGYSPYNYDGGEVTFLALGIPRTPGNALVVAVGAAYLVSILGTATLLLRRASARDLVPVSALMLTQALWFSAPFAVQYFGWHTGVLPLDAHAAIRDYTLWTFLAHGVQYLWVTTYFAKASGSWRGYANYLGKVSIAGIAIWTLPFILFSPDRLGRFSFDGGMALIVASAVNLHHFVLDGAIWKLRNSRIASVLIRSQRNAPGPLVPARTWPRRLVYATALLVTLVGFAQVYMLYVAIPTRYREGDTTGMRLWLDRLAWIGYDHARYRVRLADAYYRAGDLDSASVQYARGVSLRPRSDIWLRLGRVQERRGALDAAAQAYRSALAMGVDRPERAHLGLERIALARGDAAAAIASLRHALASRPDDPTATNERAWVLATSFDAGERDPEESIRLARRLIESSSKPDPNVLDTLAAGYATAGRLDEAVRVSVQALELAAQRGDERLSEEIQERLGLYRAGRAYVAARPSR